MNEQWYGTLPRAPVTFDRVNTVLAKMRVDVGAILVSMRTLVRSSIIRDPPAIFFCDCQYHECRPCQLVGI